MAFIKNLYRDEMRSGYLVSSAIKKVWNRQLELWQELDRICRKHAIKYWAGYGTLLGAVRHGGFIPWDVDIDFCMMRPDYDRFMQIVEDELIQGGNIFELRLKSFVGCVFSHSQTTALFENEMRDKTPYPNGLTLDVFPLDVAPDGTPDSSLAMDALIEFVDTMYAYPALVRCVQSGEKTVNDWDVIDTLYRLTEAESKFKFVNVYAMALFNQSTAVAWIENMQKKEGTPFQKAWFRKTVYLPFETVKLPAPIDYEKVLTARYGDWRTPFNDGQNKVGFISSADIPYREFFAQADIDLFLPKK